VPRRGSGAGCSPDAVTNTTTEPRHIVPRPQTAQGIDWTKLGHPHDCDELPYLCLGSIIGSTCEEQARRAGERLVRLRQLRAELADILTHTVDGSIAGRPVEHLVIELRDNIDTILRRAS
jgi:hypothetical protein